MKLKAIILSVTLAAGMGLAADRPPLSGTWVLDANQSSGDAPAWASMTVAQKGHWFRMAQIDKEGRTIRNIEGECKTDGRFHPVQGGDAGSISCKWDGGTLVTQQHWNNGQDERTVRTMVGSDGKLVQDIHEAGPGGAKDAHSVWARQ